MTNPNGHNENETRQLDEEFTSIVREGTHEDHALLYELIFAETERLRTLEVTSYE